MYENILLAIDASEQSKRAVSSALELGKLSGGTVHLFHVQEAQVVVGKSGGSFNVEESEEATSLVGQARQTLEQAGVKVEGEVIHAELGHAAEKIVAAAKDLGVDLIVMGSHGRTSLGAFVLGSNAYKVLHLTDRPVLVVR